MLRIAKITNGAYPSKNFGLIDIDWEHKSVQLTVNAIDGTPVITQAVAFSELTFGAGSARGDCTPELESVALSPIMVRPLSFWFHSTLAGLLVLFAFFIIWKIQQRMSQPCKHDAKKKFKGGKKPKRK
jgi:hypothetical protein